MENDHKKIIAITGASKGIGQKIAKNLIDKNHHIIAIAREIKELELLDDYALSRGNTITIVPLDIKDFSKIDYLGAQLFSKFGKLDGFIANAAILGGCMPINHISPEMWQEVMDTNLTANYRFLRSFDALFKKAEKAEVVFISDNQHLHSSQCYFGPYAISKMGLESLANIYKAETQMTKINVNILYPPITKTKLHYCAFPGDLKNYDNIEDMKKFLARISRIF